MGLFDAEAQLKVLDWGGGGWRNAKNQLGGLRLDGTTDDRNAWAAMDEGEAYLIPPGVSVIGSSVAVPAVSFLRFEPGAFMQPITGAEVTIDSPYYAAPGENPFDTSEGGTFVLGPNAERIHRPLTELGPAINYGGGEDDLLTRDIPANRVAENGQSVSIKAFGSTAANGNSKTLTLYVGGTEVLTTGAVAANDEDWIVEATVVRDGPTTAVVSAHGFFNGSLVGPVTTEVTLASTGWDVDQTVRLTAEGTGDGDIVAAALLVGVSH